MTNVAAFGAFIDIGVHQDGLAHVSALAARFVKDPHEVVKAGQVVKVKVLDVDLKRQRIALTMRLDDDETAGPPRGAKVARDANADPRGKRASGRPRKREAVHAMAAAFAKLKAR